MPPKPRKNFGKKPAPQKNTRTKRKQEIEEKKAKKGKTVIEKDDLSDSLEDSSKEDSDSIKDENTSSSSEEECVEEVKLVKNTRGRPKIEDQKTLKKSWTVVCYTSHDKHLFETIEDAKQATLHVPKTLFNLHKFTSKKKAESFIKGITSYVVVFKDSNEKTKFDTMEAAKTAMKMVPPSIWSIRKFETEEETEAFMRGSDDSMVHTNPYIGVVDDTVSVSQKNNTQNDNASIVTPATNNPYAKKNPYTGNKNTFATQPPQSIAIVNPYAKLPQRNLSSELQYAGLTQEQKENAVYGCEKLRQDATLNSAQFRVTVISYEGNQQPRDNCTRVVSLSVLDSKEIDYWNFKPPNWEHTFRMNSSLNQKGKPLNNLDSIVNGFAYGKRRGETINEHLCIQKPSYLIKYYILYKIFPFGDTEEDIKAHAKLILEEMTKDVTKGWYISTFERPGRVSDNVDRDINPITGNFWRILDMLKKKEPVIKYYNSLDSIYACDAIWNIIHTMFGPQPSNPFEWNDDIRNFAFGETLPLTQDPIHYQPNVQLNPQRQIKYFP
jgi:hypothetical protein